MLTIGSADVVVCGFTRIAIPPTRIEGCRAVNLGKTEDGRLLERIGSVAAVALRLGPLAKILDGCQVIIARNLEMLLIATRARRRYAPNAALVFECLDLHRLLLSGNLAGRLLRWIETRLVKEVDLVLTSSPRFTTEYFTPRQFKAPIELLENKVLPVDLDVARPSLQPRPHGPPWKIGWFGMIRCQRSLEILKTVTREAGGNVKVVIAGRPSLNEFPDFENAIARHPHISFSGGYRFDELASLYAGVHFSWAVDYFEQGLNSSWLLPNRIYESSYFGAVPIAAEGVETARWLSDKNIGLVLRGEPKNALSNILRGMTDLRFRALSDALRAIPTIDLAESAGSCRQLIGTLAHIRPHIVETSR